MTTTVATQNINGAQNKNLVMSKRLTSTHCTRVDTMARNEMCRRKTQSAVKALNAKYNCARIVRTANDVRTFRLQKASCKFITSSSTSFGCIWKKRARLDATIRNMATRNDILNFVYSDVIGEKHALGKFEGGFDIFRQL